MAAPRFRWGIAGPGSIAEVFATSLQGGTTQQITAVGSRSRMRSEAFASRFDIPRAHASYQSLFDDPNVDIIYIATPHTFHTDLAEAALRVGKHVLAEKPISVRAGDTAKLQQLSQQQGLFLMEAMWPRCLPSWDSLRQLLSSSQLGRIRALRADLGEYFTPDPQSRLFNPNLAGGALYDLGVYLVALSSFVLGPPTEVHARRSLTETDVDGQVSFTLLHGYSQITDAFTTLYGAGPTQATIFAEHATVHLDSPWYTAQRVAVVPHDDTPVARTFDVASQQEGFAYEISEVARCVHAGAQESALMPLTESLQMQQTLEALASTATP